MCTYICVCVCVCQGKVCPGGPIPAEASINQSTVLTKPHIGNEKPHPGTATEGSKPCVTKCRRSWGANNESNNV